MAAPPEVSVAAVASVLAELDAGPALLATYRGVSGGAGPMVL